MICYLLVESMVHNRFFSGGSRATGAQLSGSKSHRDIGKWAEATVNRSEV
jgi:hypothetical protein